MVPLLFGEIVVDVLNLLRFLNVSSSVVTSYPSATVKEVTVALMNDYHETVVRGLLLMDDGSVTETVTAGKWGWPQVSENGGYEEKSAAAILVHFGNEP